MDLAGLRSLWQMGVVEADATDYRAPWLADCVYFSYALTMIPDWVRALSNALSVLKPGGKLGIVGFTDLWKKSVNLP
jgi:S-adenosylmethionine-diacylgycerolhomoserine-N-methlytransferase